MVSVLHWTVDMRVSWMLLAFSLTACAAATDDGEPLPDPVIREPTDAGVDGEVKADDPKPMPIDAGVEPGTPDAMDEPEDPPEPTYWDVVLVDGDIDSTDPEDDSWDSLSDPDPFVQVIAGDCFSLGESSTIEDSLTPNFGDEVVLAAHPSDCLESGGLLFWVFDSDAVSDDFICELTDCPLTPTGQTLECYVERGTEGSQGTNAACAIRYKIVPAQ